MRRAGPAWAEVERGGTSGDPARRGQRADVGQRGGGHEHDDAVGHQHDRSGAAVRGLAQRDPDTMPGGQLRADEQAEPVCVGEVEVRRLRELLIDLGELGGLDAEPAVIDLDGESVGHAFRSHLDPGSRRGEHGRVLDQLGQQMDHVGDGRGGDRVLRRGQDRDPAVVLDLRHGRPDDVDDRHRLGPGPAGRRPGQDGQAFRVPSHPGGEVIQREKIGQRRGVGRLLFQRVDQPELPLQQGLVAPGQAHEYLAEAVAQPCLPSRRPDRGLLQAGHRREGLGDLRALRLRQGLRYPGPTGRGAGVPATQPFQQLRKLLIRGAAGRGRQPCDIAGEPGGEAAHQNDAYQGDEEARTDENR